jgi:hypothetical protein
MYCLFSFDHCVVCFLLTIVLSVFFWPLCCLFSFDHKTDNTMVKKKQTTQ